MFCIQETERTDPFANGDKDPLSTPQSESSDEEPTPKRLKTFNSSLNLKVYQIPAFNTPSSLSIFPPNTPKSMFSNSPTVTTNSLSIYPSSPTNSLPKFVNNPLNLANPLALAANNANNVVKSLHSRYSLPAKLTITPVSTPKTPESGEVVRYKKNGEVAKKRGPPKGYKRKPKADMSCSLVNITQLQPQNTILTNLLSTSTPSVNATPPVVNQTHTAVPKVKVPEGFEHIELNLDPEDWFPAEPYKMVFSRKKNPKWKNFPYRCEHCFKGYRVASTLVTHAAERHGAIPKDLAVPCPCCPHVSTRRKLHKRHLDTHASRKHRIFCLYCLPPPDPSEPYVKESEKYPYDKYPQYWYASEESLRLHKKRKHPYAAMFNYNWFSTWGENNPNS